MRRESQLEATLALHIKALRLPEPEREHRFHESRGWRFDFAWPSLRVAAEVEGGTWSGGRHTRGAGFEGDCEKYNEAVLAGWAVLRFTRRQITHGDALRMIAKAIERAGGRDENGSTAVDSGHSVVLLNASHQVD